MKIKAVFTHEVDVNPAEAFEKIKEYLGFTSTHDTFLGVKDGELRMGRDISYHGSPMYEYETISNNPKWVELYNSVKCLDDYFNHSQEPQWQKNIEPELDEDFTLKM